MLNDDPLIETRVLLNELYSEHRDLDLVIEHLVHNPPHDELLVRRLKKRKLLLKDRIAHLEQALTPDVPA